MLVSRERSPLHAPRIDRHRKKIYKSLSRGKRNRTPLDNENVKETLYETGIFSTVFYRYVLITFHDVTYIQGVALGKMLELLILSV